MRRLTLLVLMLLATPAVADLPARGWPQARRDAAQTGRIDEQALPSGRLRWQVLTGAELSGEPVVTGCSVVVTSGDGAVHAYNARSGTPLWTYGRDWSVPPAGVSSALAIDGGEIHAGLPADPLLDRAMRALILLRVAFESYAIDNNSYPPGPDLEAALTPTYIRSLPPNPATGVAMIASDVPSLGDYRYESASSGGEFHLGIWGAAGGLLDFGAGCVAGGPGAGGLAPSWPVSAERGGSRTTLRMADGALVRQDLSVGIALSFVPTVTPGAVDWASQEIMDPPLSGWWGGWWSWWWDDPNTNDRWPGGAVRRVLVKHHHRANP